MEEREIETPPPSIILLYIILAYAPENIITCVHRGAQIGKNRPSPLRYLYIDKNHADDIRPMHLIYGEKEMMMLAVTLDAADADEVKGRYISQ